MSKYLVVGDPHARPDNLHKINKLFHLVESKELPVIWLGDMLDTKDIVRAQCLNAYINYFKNSKLNHIVLIGNHDQLSANTQDHALEALKLLPNVKVVDKPYILDNLLFVPYYRSPEDFKLAISQARAIKSLNYLFMHQDIVSMDYGNGYISTEGNTLEDLKGFKLVISGHYHSYQDKDNLIYLGTPFSHNFGDTQQDKYLGVFDSESGKFQTIPTDFPKHITVTLDLSNPHHFEINEQDHGRVILKGTREQLDKFDMKMLSKFKIVQECQSNVVKSGLKETDSPEEIYSKWYKEVNKGEDAELFNLGLEVLKIVK